MSKQSYTMRTANGFKQLDVEADDDAHKQLQAVLKGLNELRDLYSTVVSIETQASNTRDWLDAAINKTQLSPFFNEELL